uniref:Photolyase/cryptochrome alpha/beta domain-containing protein n=1 Tax=Strix occidentalis caurina TaxID=311401 RepID=A0A8D0EZE3_STROC
MLHRTVHLFWKRLWLHDNPTLLAALESSEVIYPVYTLGRKFMISVMHTGALRWHFLLEDLQKNLCELGSCLLVIQGEYESVLRDHIQMWNITQVALDAEMEPFYEEMEANVRRLGDELGFEVLSLVGHSLCDTKSDLVLLGGTPPLMYKRFLHILSLLGDPEVPVRNLTAEDFQRCRPPDPGLAECYRAPLPVDLKIPPKSLSPWRGGETKGLQRLEQHLTDQVSLDFTWVMMVALDGLSLVSTLLLLCVVSALVLAAKHHSLPLVLLQGQLLWREFYTATPNFTRMVGNPICLQISWYEDAERLHKWRTFQFRVFLGDGSFLLQAQTGFLWIDAIMTQLRQEGWIHHLARHAVACFLTRGDLWISWEEGMEVFEELLLGADYSINAGNWMWLSASAFFHQVESSAPSALGNPTLFLFCRKYLPILKNFPSKYIYEPWRASEEEQKQAGIREGLVDFNSSFLLAVDDRDDPMEMKVKHEHSEENISKGKKARMTQQTEILPGITCWEPKNGTRGEPEASSTGQTVLGTSPRKRCLLLVN